MAKTLNQLGVRLLVTHLVLFLSITTFYGGLIMLGVKFEFAYLYAFLFLVMSLPSFVLFSLLAYFVSFTFFSSTNTPSARKFSKDGLLARIMRSRALLILFYFLAGVTLLASSFAALNDVVSEIIRNPEQIETILPNPAKRFISNIVGVIALCVSLLALLYWIFPPAKTPFFYPFAVVFGLVNGEEKKEREEEHESPESMEELLQGRLGEEGEPKEKRQ